jgi:hypothetical protein
MAFPRQVTLMRTRAEMLRRGSVRGSGRAPIRFTPAVPQALGPTASEDKASSSPMTLVCAERESPAEPPERATRSGK